MTGAAVASAAVGSASLIGGKRAGKNAQEASDVAIGQANDLNKYLKQLGTEGVEYAQGLMDNWEGTFGGIQDNLSDYYNNLDPNKYSTQAKSDYTNNMNKQMKQFDESMAASGLQSAGMKQQASQEAAFSLAEGNAAIDIGAEDKVRGMQQGFVNSGEGQRSQATNMMNSAQNRQGQYATTGANAVMSAYTGKADAYGASQSGYMGAGGSMLGSSIGLGIAGGAFGGGGGIDAKGQKLWDSGYAGTGQEGIQGPRKPGGLL